MTDTEKAKFEYRGFEVFTGLVRFDALGWTARYSIFFLENGPRDGRIVHGGEVRVSSNHVNPALDAARNAARLWIDRWVAQGQG